ncbi:MAG: hypothetical protein WBG50_28385 [Desulfomonilaceae bacterium]
MTEAYNREKFLEAARALEAERLAKLEEWNKKNEAWIKEHGPIPFQVPRLVFDGK